MLQQSTSFWGQIRAVLVLGLPLAAASMAQLGLHISNTLLVGHYNTTSLSALVISTSAFFVIFVLGSGFARAVTPLVATARVQGSEQDRKSVV